MRSTIFTRIVFFILLTFWLTSCEVIGDIFKAGIWVGILIVVGIVALLFFILRRL